MITNDEIKRRMRVIADYPRSKYKNQWPYNLLYWDGTRWYGDCVNIYKALFNGRDVDNPENCFYSEDYKAWFQNDTSLTGDCTEAGLLEQCEEVSSDFSNLYDGKMRVLYLPGHIGGHLGEEITLEDGRTVNCVECTNKWEDGIQYSYCDTDGTRRYKKNGASFGTWTKHGLPTKWIVYPEEATREEETVEEPFDFHKELHEIISRNVKVSKGDFNGYVSLWQKQLREEGFYTDTVDGSFGTNTYSAVKEWQKAHGITADGIIGYESWTTLFSEV